MGQAAYGRIRYNHQKISKNIKKFVIRFAALNIGFSSTQVNRIENL
jgi:hypothetical protein